MQIEVEPQQDQGGKRKEHEDRHVEFDHRHFGGPGAGTMAASVVTNMVIMEKRHAPTVTHSRVLA